MKLNHANICTNNVTKLIEIFTQHFGFEVIQTNEFSGILKGSDNFSLVLTAIDKDSTQLYPNSLVQDFRINFHVGFSVEKPEEVYRKHQELIDAGHNPKQINTFDTLGTSWTAFYLPVGDGIEIEVTCSVK